MDFRGAMSYGWQNAPLLTLSTVHSGMFGDRVSKRLKVRGCGRRR